jgi:lantibiotic modifying enzyme
VKRFVLLPMGLALICVSGANSKPHVNSDYLNSALAAARWIQSTAVEVPSGVVWPADPADPKSVNTTLYAGTPGPILFFLEAYRYTRNDVYLAEARKGADALLTSISEKDGAGLYEGLAGSGFTLGETYLVTHDTKYREGALQCIRWIANSAKKSGKGIDWGDTTDIISGSSGTGLFLLWADRNLHAPDARDLAIAAGNRLIERGSSDSVGTKWMMDSTSPREMPNFSHGTAAVAYFLATLYQETHERRFLDAAVAGAHYLISIADRDPNICLIYHDNQNKNLYYLGWCHGPAGTVRLFYRLYPVTRDPQWMEWTRQCARAILAEGGPEKAVTSGEWRNVNMCCGVAAEAEFFLDMYSLSKDPRDLAVARKGSDRLLSLATNDSAGERWVQVETRVQPDVALAQTGFMQGASGIGMWFLYIDGAIHGSHVRPIVFPDNPFAY